MSATLVRTEPATCGVATTDQEVPRDTVARPTSQASLALLAPAASGTVLVAPGTVGPVTSDQAVPFHRATSGRLAPPCATAQASLSVRAETAVQSAPAGGGGATICQVTAAPAGAAPAGAAPAQEAPCSPATAVASRPAANPYPRMNVPFPGGGHFLPGNVRRAVPGSATHPVHRRFGA